MARMQKVIPELLKPLPGFAGYIVVDEGMVLLHG
jgi:hypothetical protein